jgi:hypothetical protein
MKSRLLRLVRGNSNLKKITITILRFLGAHSVVKKIIVKFVSAPPTVEMIHMFGKPLIEKQTWLNRFEESRELRTTHKELLKSQPKDKRLSAKQEISVLSSLFRSDEFLVDLLENILSQTALASSEIVFVSVSPSSFVRRELEKFKLLLPAAQIVESVERIGIYEAWNIGVASTKSPLITNWNADDRRSKTSLEQQIAFMGSSPWASGSYADTYITIDALADFEVAAYCGALTNHPPFLSLHHSFSGANPMHNAPVWRRDLHLEHGLFDESLVSAGDYEFWLRCQMAGEVFVKSPIPYATYFVNPTGVSTRPGTEGVDESRVIQAKYKREISRRLTNRNLPGFHSSLQRHNMTLIKKLEGRL